MKDVSDRSVRLCFSDYLQFPNNIHMQKQVLLTRSNFLADKLRVHVCKLIESITSKSLTMKAAQEDDAALGSSTTDLRTTTSALDLSDGNFPLICTFEDFLELLESTVRFVHETI